MKSTNVLVLVAIVLALVVYFGFDATTDLSNGVRGRLALLMGPAVGWGAWLLWQRRGRGSNATEGLDGA
ncbi:hypothetical protein [Sanguibacter sp. 25GB23B1]|uniref:hypothetical protein n=1 Tax=unclassified Sanguibacter TaxID=2645534 RepID=UPI0032AF5F67